MFCSANGKLETEKTLTQWQTVSLLPTPFPKITHYIFANLHSFAIFALEKYACMLKFTNKMLSNTVYA